MPNEFLNPVVILADALVRWENSIVLFKQVNREFDGRFAVPNEKAGYTVNARMPNRFRGRRGDQAHPEEIRETSVPVTIDTLWGQDLEFSDQDLTLTIDRFGERYTQPGVDTIANMMDGDMFDKYIECYNFVGTPGTTPATMAPYANAGVALANHACPPGNLRAMVISPEMEATILVANLAALNPPKEISRQYFEGTMGRALGFKFSMAQNVARHVTGALGTAGAPTSTPIVAGANQTGATLNTSGWDANQACLLRGDIISIAGMDGVNPVSYRDTGQLRTFVVTANCTADAAGLISIPIDPPISADPNSPFQTVTALPGNGAVLRVYNTLAAGFGNIDGVASPQGLAFHRDALTIAIVPLETPGGLDWSEMISNPKIGVSMRLTRDFNIELNRRITRLDVLGGIKVLRKEWIVRVCG